MLSVVIMWAQELDHVMIAGDRDQVINRFDGARRDIYDRIPDYLDLSEVLLDTSYRFPENIWVAARCMLTNAHDVPPVIPAGSADHRGRIDVRESPQFSANWVGETWTDDGTPAPSEKNSPANLYDRFVANGPYDDCLVMARTQTQIKGVQHVLNRAGVPYTTQSDIRGWLSPLSSNLDDATRLSIYNLVTRLARVDVDTVTETEVIQQSHGKQVSARAGPGGEGEAPVEQAPPELTTHSDRDEVRKYVELADPTLDAAKLPLRRQGWTAFTDSRTTALASLNEWHNNHAEYRSVRQAFDRYNGILTRHEPQYMKLRTIHAAKGSEADVAVVYDGLTNKIMDAVMNDEKSRKNEYRTWYVAFSRPREHLCILRGAWLMNTTSLIPQDFASRVVSQANREYDTLETES
jgi:superfamily I DNA/RNA helicase